MFNSLTATEKTILGVGGGVLLIGTGVACYKFGEKHAEKKLLGEGKKKEKSEKKEEKKEDKE